MKISPLDPRVTAEFVDALSSLRIDRWPRHEHSARHSLNIISEMVFLTSQGFVVRKKGPGCFFLSKQDGSARTELIAVLKSKEDLTPEHEGYICDDLVVLDETLRLLRKSCFYIELPKFHTDADGVISYMFKHNESELGLQVLCRDDRFFDDLKRRAF